MQITPIVQNFWTGLFIKPLRRTNQALDKLPLSPLDAVTKNKLIAEVRFPGADTFILISCAPFGGVPKLDRVP